MNVQVYLHYPHSVSLLGGSLILSLISKSPKQRLHKVALAACPVAYIAHDGNPLERSFGTDTIFYIHCSNNSMRLRISTEYGHCAINAYMVSSQSDSFIPCALSRVDIFQPSERYTHIYIRCSTCQVGAE